MGMTPGFSLPTVFGEDATFFPDVALSFLTSGTTSSRRPRR
jgi:hypothetical protein